MWVMMKGTTSLIGVISEPEVYERVLTDDDRVLVMGSDGLWEFIPSQEVDGQIPINVVRFIISCLFNHLCNKQHSTHKKEKTMLRQLSPKRQQ